MRTATGLTLAGALALGLGLAAEARAQNALVVGVPIPYGNHYYYPPQAPYYPPQAPPAYQRVYSFKDEPLVSVNRSYLGYSNFVYTGPGLPPGGYPTGYRWVPAQNHSYGYNYGYAPAPRPFRWFGWRRYGY